MECKDVQELLSAYLDEVIDETEKNALEQHLSECAGCRQELADLQRIVEIIKSLDEVIPPENFRQQIGERLKVQKVTETGLTKFKKIKTSWLALAAVLVMGLGIGLMADNIYTPLGSITKTKSLAEAPSTVKDNSAQNYGAQQQNKGDHGYSYKVAADEVLSNEDSSKDGIGKKELQEAKEESTIRGSELPRLNRAEIDAQQPEANPAPEIALGNQVAGIAAEPAPAPSPDIALDDQVAGSEVTAFGVPLRDEPVDPDSPVSSQDNINLADTKVAMDDSQKEKAEVKQGIEAAQGEALSEETADTKLQKASQEQKELAQNQPSAVQQHKIIKNGWLTLEVKLFDKAAREIATVAQQFGGYVESSQEYANGQKSGSFVVRVPVGNFPTAFSELQKLGKVLSKRLGGENVSIEYRDASARLRNLQRQEGRLLALVDKAESLGDVLALENELSRIRQEIETIEARINYLSNVTEMATITLEVNEVKEKNTPGPEGVFKRTWHAFTESCRQLLNGIEYLIVSLGWALPYLALLTAGIIAYRRYKKKQ